MATNFLSNKFQNFILFVAAFSFLYIIVRKKSEKDAYLRRYRHFVKKRF